PRFLRPWFFSAACARALRGSAHQVSIGFDKTWGQDILYPQGGLYRASAEHNLLKYPHPLTRHLVEAVKLFDLRHWAYTLLERRQYLGPRRPLVVAISNMVRRHFLKHYGIPPGDLRVVRIATDPTRFEGHDRPRRRVEWRERWGVRPDEAAALF